MKVLVCHNYYQHPSGEFQVVSNEVDLLREHGIDVRVYARRNEEIDGYGCAARLRLACETVYSRRTRRELKRLFGEWRPDVAHVHNVHPLISPSVYDACRAANVPVVQTLHNYRWLCISADFFRGGRVCEDCRCKPCGRLHGLAHRCYRGNFAGSLALTAAQTIHETMLRTYRRKVSAIVVLTDFVKKTFAANGYNPTQLHVKPNFTRVSATQPARDEGYYFFAGRLAEAKGVRLVLEAAAHVGGDIPFHVAGDGPLKQELAESVRVRGLRNVRLLGGLSHAECLDRLSRCRALLFPSMWYECMPMSILEAFAYGKPVIASDLGAMPCLVSHGENGMLFAPGDASALAGCVRGMEGDGAKTGSMGTAARERAVADYGPQKNFDVLARIYGSVMR